MGRLTARGSGSAGSRWLSCLLIGVASVAPVLYPLWLVVKSRRLEPRQPPQPEAWPGLSVVVAAYLEREVIAAKVADLRRQEYPGELQILVVAEDAGTADAARAAGAEVLQPEERLGKTEAVNRGMAAAVHPIVAITDADTKLATGSLAALARWFADGDVGGVAGEKREEAGGQGMYWRFESWVKRCESENGTTIGMVGELAAVRRALYREMPADVAVDDLWMGLDVIEQGGVIRYEPEAVAVEKPSPDLGTEWERRTRTNAGLFDLLRRRWHLLVPGESPVAGELWGHKLMRSLFGPLAHAGLLIQSLVRFRRSRLARLFVVGHLFAGISLLREWRGAKLTPLERYAAQVVFLQATALGGALRYAGGDRPALWPKSERAPDSGEVFDEETAP
jgi:glycosyltransferase involved in cell wall biosynthesis